MFIYLLLYVDDIITAAKDMSEINYLKIVGREFDIKDLGPRKALA